MAVKYLYGEGTPYIGLKDILTYIGTQGVTSDVIIEQAGNSIIDGSKTFYWDIINTNWYKIFVRNPYGYETVCNGIATYYITGLINNSWEFDGLNIRNAVSLGNIVFFKVASANCSNGSTITFKNMKFIDTLKAIDPFMFDQHGNDNCAKLVVFNCLFIGCNTLFKCTPGYIMFNAFGGGVTFACENNIAIGLNDFGEFNGGISQFHTNARIRRCYSTAWASQCFSGNAPNPTTQGLYSNAPRNPFDVIALQGSIPLTTFYSTDHTLPIGFVPRKGSVLQTQTDYTTDCNNTYSKNGVVYDGTTKMCVGCMAVPPTLLDAPTSITFVQNGVDSITMTATEVIGATKYFWYRSASSTEPYGDTPIGQTTTNVFTYTVPENDKNSLWFYFVEAIK